jgi:pyrrolidone-carboxylate peptidase
MTSAAPVKVLVTGFGAFLNVSTNPSWEIARRLPSSIMSLSGESIQVIVPTDPMPAAYHDIKEQVSSLIDLHAPDIVVHMGLDVDSGRGVFKVERSAPREGYHEIPDVCRKVYTRAENKKGFGKSPASLSTTLDVDAVEEIWRAGCASVTLAKEQRASHTAKGKSSGIKNVLVHLSDDVGTYVCGFCYYVALLHMQSHTGKRHAVFFHVPPLETEAEILVGVRVTQEVVRALVQVM